jgi:uncharacterized membrane protein YobD (UPF0266 family)
MKSGPAWPRKRHVKNNSKKFCGPSGATARLKTQIKKRYLRVAILTCLIIVALLGPQVCFDTYMRKYSLPSFLLILCSALLIKALFSRYPALVVTSFVFFFSTIQQRISVSGFKTLF